MRSDKISSPSDTKYPVIMENIQENLVVLFKSRKQGVVIYSTTDSFRLGFFSNSWEMQNFRKFDGEIQLAN
jgi:hypothetical protein